MSTSGTYSFTLTRNQLILRAWQTAGVIGLEQGMSAEKLSYGTDMLNMLIKHMDLGQHIWSSATAAIFLQNGQAQYKIGASTDHAALLSDCVNTTTSAAANSAQNQIVVSSITSSASGTVKTMAVNDQIAVLLTTGYLQWTTISAINATTLTITLAANLAASVASGATVYTYTTALTRPQQIMSCYLRNSSGLDRKLNLLSSYDYLDMPNKLVSGTVTGVYYDPQESLEGVLSCWQEPNDPTSFLIARVRRPLQDFNSSTDNPDVPGDWVYTLHMGLAANLCSVVGKDAKKASLMQDFMMAWQQAKLADTEVTETTMGSNDAGNGDRE